MKVTTITKYKCRYCKDTGVIQLGRSAKATKKCPYCKGASAKTKAATTTPVVEKPAPKPVKPTKPAVPRGQRKMEVIYK